MENIGTDILFPIQFDESGKPQRTEGSETIEQSIKHILMWDFPMYFHHKFFCKIPWALDELMTVASKQLVRRYVIDAIKEFEPRVKLKSAEVFTNDTGMLVFCRYDIIPLQKEEKVNIPLTENII